jgi:hypothetical protein
MLTRDLDFGPEVKVRLLIKKDIIEIYVNDYLMNSKRMKCNGRIGVVGKADPAAVRDIKVWTEKRRGGPPAHGQGNPPPPRLRPGCLPPNQISYQ